MSFDASEFLLSLSDLFVVILPGFFMLVFGTIIFRWWKTGWFERVKKRVGVSAWIIILALAFLTGHFISQFGSLTEDAYWRARHGEIAKEKPELRRKAMELASAALPPEVEVTASNVRRWAAVLLRHKTPNFGERLDRLDVERRFFRNILIVFFFAAVLAAIEMINLGRKGKSMRSYALLMFLFSAACGLSTMRYFYENTKFTQEVFENFIAASAGIQKK